MTRNSIQIANRPNASRANAFWKKIELALAFSLVCLFSFSCAFDKLALNIVGDALTGEGSNTVFTGDDDFELVAGALPFAIKFYESLSSANPDHQGLLRTTGSMYIMYANAFVLGPSEYLPGERYEDKQIAELRAGKLYLRGRNMIIAALDKVYPGFSNALLDGDPQPFLAKMEKKDTAALYWICAGWFGAFSLDNMNMTLSLKIGNALACLDRAYALNPDFQNGSLDELYISIKASLPAELGGSMERAKYHFDRAITLSKNLTAGPYLAWATAVYIGKQDKAAFVDYMNTILALDLDAIPESRLQNVMAQKKARWYLDHLDELFLE